jgi:uncharacterized membrane protein
MNEAREVASGVFQHAEHSVQEAVLWLKLGVETVGALVIAVGVVVALIQLVRFYLAKRKGGYTNVRLTLARYLALALEFQLGADILSTAIAPSWNEIGQLGAIAVIRTALNFFLSIEMKEERRQREEEIDQAHP